MHDTTLTPETFMTQIAGRRLDAALDDGLDAHHGARWLVCPPGRAHRLTVRQGRARGLCLLPEGQIDFTR